MPGKIGARPTAGSACALLGAALLLSFAAASGAADPPAVVQRGEYLARAGDCISCHTTKGGQPYAGGLRVDTPFGYLLGPNITPDNDTGIGRWSSDDFYRALHDGVNRRGQDMYPVMPYNFFTKVTRADSDAIFAYLRTLKPVRNAVDVNHLNFPFNQRWSMAVWRELYFNAGTYKADPTRSAAWNRGAYLVEGLGHCSACHSPRNPMGAIEKNKAFTGATIDGWFALNLTSNMKTGLGDWSVEQIATYLKTGASKAKSTALGPMAEVVHNSLSFMTQSDLSAMAEYLKALPASSALRSGQPLPDLTRAEGATLYMDHCGGCHQAGGRGIPGIFPPLAGNGVVIAPDPANLFKVVLAGVPARGRYGPMPSFAAQLTDQEIATIANYVRTSWGNAATADAIAATVARLRK